MAQLEIWVVLDENGDYSVGEDRDIAIERHEENVGGVDGARLFKLTLTASRPVPVEMDVEVLGTSGVLLVGEGISVE